MEWQVFLTQKAQKGVTKLPKKILARLEALLFNMRESGPIQIDMPNFGRLKHGRSEIYHCHLNKGRPRYVVVWEAKGKKVRIIEVNYVGTHEKAPY